MTDEIALLVGAPTREIEAMAVSQGMFTLREDGVRLAVAGITTLEEVRRVAGDTVDLSRRTVGPASEADYGSAEWPSSSSNDRHAIAAFLRRNAPRPRLRARRPRRLRLALHPLVRLGAGRPARAGRAALHAAGCPRADRDRRGAERRRWCRCSRALLHDAAVAALRPRHRRRCSRSSASGTRSRGPSRTSSSRSPAPTSSRRAPLPVDLLGESDLLELDELYRAAYPGTWFTPRMLATGRYVGIRHDGRLACVAGVHVYSPTWGVAALGNVATLPELRGRGLARAACAALCLLPARGRDRDDRAQREGGQRAPRSRAYLAELGTSR